MIKNKNIIICSIIFGVIVCFIIASIITSGTKYDVNEALEGLFHGGKITIVGIILIGVAVLVKIILTVIDWWSEENT
jgi:hypothetical protein